MKNGPALGGYGAQAMKDAIAAKIVTLGDRHHAGRTAVVPLDVIDANRTARALN